MGKNQRDTGTMCVGRSEVRDCDKEIQARGTWLVKRQKVKR